MQAKFDDPTYRERHSANSKATIAKRLQTPEGQAHHRRFMEIGEANLAKPEIAQMARDAQFRKHNPWCPVEMRRLNKRLRKLGFDEAERRKIILADVPGTPEHAKRAVANAATSMRIKHARDQAQAY